MEEIKEIHLDNLIKHLLKYLVLDYLKKLNFNLLLQPNLMYFMIDPESIIHSIHYFKIINFITEYFNHLLLIINFIKLYLYYLLNYFLNLKLHHVLKLIHFKHQEVKHKKMSDQY